MKAYCINLKTSTDRRVIMQRQFDEQNLKVEFVDGYNARVENPQLENPIYIGDFGNLMSLRKVFEDMVQTQTPFALVFEDTARLVHDFKTKVENLPLPDRWDIIYLGYVSPVFWIDENEQLARGKALGTWSFLVSLECAKKLLAFDPLDHWITLDVHISSLPLRTFYVKDRLTIRDPTLKTINGANFITRGSLQPLFMQHILQWFPVLEILLIGIFFVLAIRLSR